MSEQEIYIGVQLVGLLLTGGGLAFTGTWQLARMEGRLAEKAQERQSELTDELIALRTEVSEAIANHRIELGETVAAIRQKINEVELESFKTFVRRDSFHEMMNSFKSEVTARIDKFELKLDRLFERVRPDRLEER